MNPKVKDEVAASIILLVCCLVIGIVIGWSARTVSTSNRLMMAKFEKLQAEISYYEAKAQEIKLIGERAPR